MGRKHKLITLEDAFIREIFKQRSVAHPRWMPDGKRLCFLLEAPGEEYKTVWMLDLEKGKYKPILDAKRVRIRDDRKPGIDNFQWSPDKSMILFCSQGPARISSAGRHFLYHAGAGKLERLSAGRTERNAKFSPDGRLLGFVRNDDLYVTNLETRKERRLTRLARPHLYVGRFGWVYEEELGLKDGWEWSPDSSRIAFYLVDERKVPEFPLIDHSPQHPKERRQRYPKAGDPNPRTQIGVVSARGGKIAWMETGHKMDGYLPRMQWTDDGKLLIQRMPRLQNRLDLLEADPDTGECRQVCSEQSTTWVGGQGKLTLLDAAKQFLWLSDRDGWRHVYLYGRNGRLIRRLTSGEYEVAEIKGVDEEAESVYFTAARPAPMERQLFAVPLSGGEPRRLTEEPGVHNITLSEDGKHFLDTFSDLDTPPCTRVCRADGSVVAELVPPRIEALDDYALGKWEMLRFKTSDGVTLNARMLLPQGFDRRKRYPAVICTYGGPGSQVVMNSWGGDWLSHYLAQEGYVVFLCDGRGSGGRGRDFMKVVYRQLGKWEAHDQIEGAKYLGRKPFVDPARIAIWGWSYGGYLSSLTTLLGGKTFAACMAVAPVTHYELYDSVYTERYMRTPRENPEGYRDGAPETHADKLESALLLVHGMADDNVHFQNTVRLAAELQKAGKRFETMFYPGKAHGIEGMRAHIFTMFARFLERNMGPNRGAVRVGKGKTRHK